MPSRNPQACVHEVREYGCFKFVGVHVSISSCKKHLDVRKSYGMKPRRFDFRKHVDYLLKLQTKACALRNFEHVQNYYKPRTVKYAEHTFIVSITIIWQFKRLDWKLTRTVCKRCQAVVRRGLAPHSYRKHSLLIYELLWDDARQGSLHVIVGWRARNLVLSSSKQKIYDLHILPSSVWRHFVYDRNPKAVMLEVWVLQSNS